MTDWQDISTAPKDGRVLPLQSRGNRSLWLWTGFWSTEKQKWVPEAALVYKDLAPVAPQPSHWQSLPYIHRQEAT